MEPATLKNAPRPSEGAVSVALRSTLLQMWLGAQRTYDPSPLFGAIETKVPRFRRKLQQDAHELLRVLMDLVDTEILNILKKYKNEYLGKPMPSLSASQKGTEGQSENSEAQKSDANPAPNGDVQDSPAEPRKRFTLEYFVTRQVGNLMINEAHNLQNFEKIDKSGLVTYVEGMFGGRVESTLMCHTCGATSSTHETFLDLSVPIPTRFLDDRVKKNLGFIPSKTNLKVSLKNSKAGNNKKNVQIVEEDVAAEDGAEDGGDEESVSYKQDYDCETLSSMGGASSGGSKKKKFVPPPTTSTPFVPTPVKLTAKQAEARVKMRLAAAAKRKDTADAKISRNSKKTPKKLNKREKKQAQLRQQATDTTLEVTVDLTELTEEQIMQLALADDSQDIEELYHKIASGAEDNDDDEGNGASADVEKVEQTAQDAQNGIEQNAETAVQEQAVTESAQETPETSSVETHEEKPTTEEPIEQQEETNIEVVETPTTIDTSEPMIAANAEPIADEQVPIETSNPEVSLESQTETSNQVEMTPAPAPSSLETSEEVSTNTLETSSQATETTQSEDKMELKEESSELSTEEKSEAVNTPKEVSTTEETVSKPPTADVTPKTPAIATGLNPNLKHDARTVARPVNLTVEACLYEFTEPEILAGANAYGCYECTKRLYVKEGRNLAPLILEYGTDAEKQAFNYQSANTSNDASSAPTELKAETVETISTQVSELAIEPETPTSNTDNGELAIADNSSSETEEPKVKEEEIEAEEEIKSEEVTAEEPNGAPATEEAEDDSKEEEPEVIEPLKEDVSQKAKKETKPLKASTKSLPLVRTVATKQMLIDEVPQVLTVHLKRFWTSVGGNSTKLENRVEFPAVLDIAPYTSPNLHERLAKGGNGVKAPSEPFVLYQLYGIVVHSGSMSGGHYVAYTRRRELPISDKASLEDIRNEWHYFSDSSVSKATLESVLNQQAYILFYERISE